MIAEGYVRDKCSAKQYSAKMREILGKKGWPVNDRGDIALLYLLSKSKSLKKRQWLWRPIAAAPHPFVCKKLIRIASRAFTCFIRMILCELPAPILRLSIQDLGDWAHGCDFAEIIAEADCKEQFNKIEPEHYFCDA